MRICHSMFQAEEHRNTVTKSHTVDYIQKKKQTSSVSITSRSPSVKNGVSRLDEHEAEPKEIEPAKSL